jgi:hypothetical protein
MDVDCENAFDLLVSNLPHRFRWPDQPGVVDQEINLAKCVDAGFNHRGHSRRTAHVCGHRQGHATGGLELALQADCLHQVQVCDDHRRAFAGQIPHDGTTQPARTSGDDSNPIGERTHLRAHVSGLSEEQMSMAGHLVPIAQVVQ